MGGIKTDVARQAICIFLPVQTFYIMCILWTTKLDITISVIHSNKSHPFALQLLYYGMTFAPTPLISLLLKLSRNVRCIRC